MEFSYIKAFVNHFGYRLYFCSELMFNSIKEERLTSNTPVLLNEFITNLFNENLSSYVIKFMAMPRWPNLPDLPILCR